ncbi:hypothetical protein MNV49_000558 [Pseudohyphozyma bogoriensis]|nr:hypothetical protein MNV49_000558 [Pseudohyphozyma bogoriensis]
MDPVDDQPTSHDQLSHMDLLTQTQNSIDSLLAIMSSTVSYLTRKANFIQVNPDIPITQTIPGAEDRDTMLANAKEMVGDFTRKAKQLEYLISVLPAAPPPTSNPTADEDEDLEALQKEMMEVNDDYLVALAEAEELQSQLSTALRKALEQRTLPVPTAAAATSTVAE